MRYVHFPQFYDLLWVSGNKSEVLQKGAPDLTFLMFPEAGRVAARAGLSFALVLPVAASVDAIH